MTPQAWICPRCNRVWAPWIDGCPKCNDNHSPATPGNVPTAVPGKRAKKVKVLAAHETATCECGHYLAMHENGKCKAHGCKCSKSGA
jgi:hypothetical protein